MLAAILICGQSVLSSCTTSFWQLENEMMKTNVRRKTFFIKGCFLLLVLSMSGVTAHAADDEIIEYQGDRYVIHVDRMNPDSEMTLMDVLNTCPEFLSLNGKKIDQDYKLRTDNIDLVVDAESFLANVKACEIDHIQICSNTSVAKAVSGTKGVIDIYYRDDWPTGAKSSRCRPMPWRALHTARLIPPMWIA